MIRIVLSFLLLVFTISGTLPDLVKSVEAKNNEKASKKTQSQKKGKKGSISSLTDPNRRQFYHFDTKVDPRIKDPFNFWTLVYSKYDKDTILIHDTEYLGIIYSKVTVTDIYKNPSLTEQEKRKLKSDRVDAELARVQGILEFLSTGEYTYKTLTEAQKKIYDLFKNINSPTKFADALGPKRLRSQTCMSGKFRKAVQVSGRYMKQFEDIFTQHGVPVEITRLVFVESMFNLKAYSKVGASGLWQFMPSTGRLYMTVDDILDERNDPIAAAHGAARLLKANYEALGSWPLAINAYNSGRGALRKAAETLGTKDIATIITQYREGSYRFASRNFYPCFLAAYHVAENYHQHFGSITKDDPILQEKFFLSSKMNFDELAQHTGLSLETLHELNPAYSRKVLLSQEDIPAGYAINIPQGESGLFARATQKIAELRMVAAQEQDKLKIRSQN